MKLAGHVDTSINDESNEGERKAESNEGKSQSDKVGRESKNEQDNSADDVWGDSVSIVALVTIVVIG